MAEVHDSDLWRYLNEDDDQDIEDFYEKADRLRDEHNDRELEKLIEEQDE